MFHLLHNPFKTVKYGKSLNKINYDIIIVQNYHNFLCAVNCSVLGVFFTMRGTVAQRSSIRFFFRTGAPDLQLACQLWNWISNSNIRNVHFYSNQIDIKMRHIFFQGRLLKSTKSKNNRNWNLDLKNWQKQKEMWAGKLFLSVIKII